MTTSLSSPSLDDLLDGAKGANKVAVLRPHYTALLNSLTDKKNWEEQRIGKILAATQSVTKDGATLETHIDEYLATLGEIGQQWDNTKSAQEKRLLDHIATALVNDALTFLQSSPKIVTKHLRVLLSTLLRDGNCKWVTYGLLSPLFASDVAVFAPYAEMVLKVMQIFPETVSMIGDLYRHQPIVIERNIPLLMELYKTNTACQLSVLAILGEISKKSPGVVAQGQIKELKEHSASADAKKVASSLEQSNNGREHNDTNAEEVDEFDKLSRKYNDEVRSRCKTVPDFKEYISRGQEGTTMLQRYFVGLGRQIPLPASFELPSGSSTTDTTLSIFFQCGLRVDGCLHNMTKSYGIAVKDKESIVRWSKIAVAALTLKLATLSGGSPAAKSAPVDAIIDFAFPKDHASLLKTPFLTSGDVRDIEEGLKHTGVLEKFVYFRANGTWVCKHCFKEEQDGGSSSNVSSSSLSSSSSFSSSSESASSSSSSSDDEEEEDNGPSPMPAPSPSISSQQHTNGLGTLASFDIGGTPTREGLDSASSEVSKSSSLSSSSLSSSSSSSSSSSNDSDDSDDDNGNNGDARPAAGKEPTSSTSSSTPSTTNTMPAPSTSSSTTTTETSSSVAPATTTAITSPTQSSSSSSSSTSTSASVSTGPSSASTTTTVTTTAAPSVAPTAPASSSSSTSSTSTTTPTSPSAAATALFSESTSAHIAPASSSSSSGGAPLDRENSEGKAGDAVTDRLRGQLYKKGRMFGGTKSRYYILDGGYLSYALRKGEKARGRIAVDTVVNVGDADAQQGKGLQNAFVVTTKSRLYIFGAESENIKRRWMQAIERAAGTAV
eukprot:TRINITY_DN937_c0_g1_i1.p1 TRINITY_DN937_c0_g1~~TRINITY_DN937_c0_g1_i1.p1  ORF type:complete len:834 (+),score=190.74 TRINITY_DN937_c0_g1_i1:155-2656(+)